MGLTPNNNSKKRGLGRAFLFGLTIAASAFNNLSSSFAGTVAPNPEQVAAYESSSEGARIKLLIALAKQGQHELADTMLQSYPLTGKYAKNRTLYIEGLILRGRKDNAGAATKFRAALADDPKLTLVRSELAQTLMAMGEDDSAKHHLQLLEADAPDEQVASNIRSFIDQIDRNRPYRFNAYMSLAPSTNINNGSSQKSSTIYGGSQLGMMDGTILTTKKSGLGSAFGVSAGYSKRLAEHWIAVAGAGASAKLYTDKSFNSYGLSQSLDLRYIQNNASIAVGLVASEGVRNDMSGLSYYAFGPRVSTSVNLTSRDVLAETIIYEQRKYPHANYANGWASFTDLAWTHTIDAGTNVTPSIGFERIKSGIDNYSYKTWYTGLDVYKEMPHGITANLSGRAQYSRFDLFNSAGQKFRKDTRLIGSLGLVKRDWNIYGFAPSVEFTFVKNFSNLNVYDYDSQAVDIRLTKDF